MFKKILGKLKFNSENARVSDNVNAFTYSEKKMGIAELK